ncbi:MULTISPECIES: ArsR/SmtB family transcription factor [Prauserella salsuginis group]|uniref:DNA-binding transcriptional ArsR family regulator n=2 Tax=Prauserella salsuginis group TaxID=2893672 RepID=A0A839XVJ5_9PSEU|nr:MULTISPECIES: metalloregulator ArsR/SmtB family transcription factor [Prauserella salsuginis group]MBB3665404.1 DNA-binding transcriptional ArsR family regulator [Prauserella sediminis]MCR3718686.1 DNA-binding transcriptional regulator, ArsR family [Prauserella flava]MCR3733256.1 DNA-binding transcriptional regulator, ArsR family [Prauserella salsuginis]
MATASSDAAPAGPPGPGETGADGHVDAGHDPAVPGHRDGHPHPDDTGHDVAGHDVAGHDHPGGPVPLTPPPSPTALTDAGELLRALAAPVRIAIVLQLRDGDRCVHDLVDALDVAQPLISQHLRVLKAAGVVHGQRRGREVAYRLVDDHLAHIVVDAVAHVQEEAKR